MMTRPRLITVEPVLFAFMLALFLSVPIQEQLIYKKICQSNYNVTICSNIGAKSHKAAENHVQSQTSNWMLYLNMAATLPSMLAVMLLGPCSDKIGRKFVMILPLIGSCIDASSLIVNAYYPKLSVSYLLFGSVISGFFGNFALVLMALFSYMADITTEKNRSLRVSLLEAMVFVGGCCGEILGGIMLDYAGYFVTFSVVLGIHILNLLYVTLIVKESYFPENKLKFSEAIYNIKDSINSIKVFTKKRSDGRRKTLLLLLLSFFSSLLVFVGSNTVKVLFALRAPLSFSSTMLGYFLATSMFYRGIGALGGAPIFIHHFKLGDYTIIIMASIGTMLKFFALALSTKTWMLFVVPLIDLLGGISVPCMRALMSKTVGKDEQGTLFSAIASVEVACTLVGSVMFNSIYSATVSWHAGFSFFMMSLAIISPIVISWYLRRSHVEAKYKEFKPEAEDDNGHHVQHCGDYPVDPSA